MSEKTEIAWTDSTVNFFSGCSKVSAGCAHCYAEARDRRQMIEKVIHFGPGAPRLKHKGAVKQALALNRKPWICDDCGKPALSYAHDSITGTTPPLVWCNCSGVDGKHFGHRRRVFSLSLGDWLDPEVPVAWFLEMAHTVWLCRDVTWILCTKRPEEFKARLLAALDVITDGTGSNAEFWQWLVNWIGGKAPQNIWLLATAENQEMADKRIPELLKIPAVVHGLSCEPLLGPIRFDTSVRDKDKSPTRWPIDWVIVGGESGSRARPCKTEWIRSIRQQCDDADVPVFVKQMGDHSIIKDGGRYRWTAKAGSDPSEWPEDLRVREFPVTTA